VVHRGAAGCGTRALDAGYHVDDPAVRHLLDPPAREIARTHVSGLFLGPEDLGGGIAREDGRDLLVRPRIELLESYDGNGGTLGVALGDQPLAELPAAEQHPIDPGGG